MILTRENMRPGHENWGWTAGERELGLDEAGWLIRVPDGFLEFSCECGVKVSGLAKEVQALMITHLTTNPQD